MFYCKEVGAELVSGPPGWRVQSVWGCWCVQLPSPIQRLRFTGEGQKLSCVFMSEYVCGKSGWLHPGRLNIWAEHGAASVGKSDEKDTEVGVKFLPTDTLLIMFSIGKLTFKRLCLHCFCL